MNTERDRATALRGVALVVAVIAIVLRIGAIERQGLWVDEVFSLAMATGHSLEHPAGVANPALGDFVEGSRPLPPSAFRQYASHDVPVAGLGRVIRAVRLSDTSPPAYYVLLGGWLRIAGTSDVALRLFSIFWTIASLPIAWALARRIGGPAAAAVACILLAVCPVAVWYSIEGRMYSLLSFVALATVWLALKVRDQNARAGTFVLLAIASVVGLLTHYFYTFVWAAAVMWLALPSRELRSGRTGVLAMIAGGLLALPWYLPAIAAVHDWRVTQGWLEQRPAGYRPIAVPVELFVSWFSNVPGEPVHLATRWCLFGLTLAAVLLWHRRAWFFSAPRMLLCLSAAAACVGPLVFDLAAGTYTGAVPRYALAGSLPALVLAATLLSRVPARLRAAAVIAVVLAWTPGLRRVYAEPARGGSPIREVAGELDARSRADDLVVVHSIPSGVVGLARYLHTSAPMLVRVGELHRAVAPADLRTLLVPRRRVFLVKIRPGGGTAPHEVYLRAHATLASSIRIRNSEVLEFVARDGVSASVLPASR